MYYSLKQIFLIKFCFELKKNSENSKPIVENEPTIILRNISGIATFIIKIPMEFFSSLVIRI